MKTDQENRVELAHIDEVLARRPALADEPSRSLKIEKAINVAKRVDELQAELAKVTSDNAALREAASAMDWVRERGTTGYGTTYGCRGCERFMEFPMTHKPECPFLPFLDDEGRPNFKPASKQTKT